MANPVYRRQDGLWCFESDVGQWGPYGDETTATVAYDTYRAMRAHDSRVAEEKAVATKSAEKPAVKRVPVNFIYTAISPTFLKMLARIAHYASEKYGSWEQYTQAPLEGEKSCINHIYEHLRQYVSGEAHDKFGDTRWHLAAIAYNAGMQFFYHSHFGAPPRHILVNDGDKELLDGKAPDPQ